ncbi:MAG: gliding motility-associated C-terminal domain-containing protein [Bacteroidia bacterium]|nr:gliding motility-associated C-terminal domain-containing protein [Bacteroidia bacterium]MCZ2247210.1 gliding motility-associated C-terminal domain-containing protein [Bacteroidia bacterium]
MNLRDIQRTRFSSWFSRSSIKLLTWSVIAFIGYSLPASATNYTVSNTNDSGPGSLRAVINALNIDASATALSPHIVDMTSLSGNIVLDSTLSEIRNHVIINGPSNNSLTIERSLTAPDFSVISVKSVGLMAIKVELNNLVITKGSSLTGGGIYVENADLTINNCQITKNYVNNGLGGGICTNNANVTINNTTIDYNTNLAGLGGGVYMNFGSLLMTNCTVFGNRAAIGGGLDKATIGTVTIRNCTFAYDTADDVGGAIYVNLGNIEVNNTIITANTATNGASAVFGNMYSVSGHNLVDNVLGMNFTGNTAGNIIGLPSNLVISNVLKKNGGPTPTVLLLACSPAIDAGTNYGAPANDQRGFVRANYGSAYDICAVEYSGPVVEDQHVCGPETITLEAQGATNYRWYDAAGNILLEGSNMLTVTVSSDTTFWVVDYTPDCESPVRVPIHVTMFPVAVAPVISADGPIVFCQGDSVTLNTTVLPEYVSYSWQPGGQSGTSITVNSTGVYNVIVTDNNGCSAQSNDIDIIVNALPIPVITSSGSTVICQGSSVDLTSSFATGNVWSTGETTQTITVDSAQTVTVTVTDANGCEGTSAPLEVSMVPTSPPAPVITASGSLNICPGSSVTLTSSYASGNIWSPNNETTQSITVSQAGTYTVTFTDANGCNAVSQPVVVTELPLPTAPVITANGAVTFCQGDSVELFISSTSVMDFYWMPVNISSVDSIFVNTSGSYYVVVTDFNNCTAASAPINVVVNNNPSEPSINPFGATTFCQGGSVTLYSSSNNNNTWSPGGETTNSIQVNTSGNYTVTVTNSAGCTAQSDTISITVLPNPIAPVVTAMGPTTFCLGESVVLASDIVDSIIWNNGQVAPDITIYSSGNYFVTTTDTNGCTAQSNVINVLVNNPGNAVITGDHQFCVGGSTVLSANNSASYLWSPNGETTQSINVTSPGIYTVTITDNSGCTSVSAPFVVTNFVPNQVSVSPSGTIQICENSSVTLVSSAVTGNVWSPNGETTQSIVVSSAGSYFVTYTDSTGCISVSDVVTVIESPAPAQPVISPAGPIVQCGGSVVLDAGTMTDVTYLWNDNTTTTQTYTATQSGSYSVTVTGLNGCTNVSTPVNVSIETMPIVNLGNDIVQCGGSVTLDAGNPGATYSWSNGETTQTITVSATATLSVTVTNSCGSVTSNPISITINNTPAPPVVTPTGPVQICNGAVQTLSSSYVSGNLWSPNGETSQDISVTTSGSYYTLITDANGCTAVSNTVVVTIENPITQVNIGNDVTQCGGTVTLNAGHPGAQYLWSTGETTQMITVASSGAYSVVVSNACGSETSNTVNITINPIPTAPVITPGGPVVFCQGNSVVLNSSQATGNTWSNGATTPSIVVSNSGTYSVTFTDANGCTAVSAPITVSSDTLLTAPNLGGPFVQCAGTLLLNPGNYPASTTYLWSNGATSPSITVNQSGNYYVILSNSCGSVQSTTAQVTINPNPPAPVVTPLGSTTFCAGGSLTLSVNIANGITWNTGETTQTITVTQSGIYFATFNDGNNCTSSSAPITVNVQQAPVAPSLGGPYSQCGGSVTLNAGNTGVGNVFLWNNGATSQQLTVQQSGSYYVSVANTCGTVQSDTAVVNILTIPQSPVITAGGPTTICSTGSVTLTSNAQQNYLWSNGETTQSIIVNQSGTYFVTTTATNGCSSTSNSITVNVSTPLNATDLGGPYTQCGGSITLDAANAGNNATYLWSNGETTQTITVSTSGNYSVQITNTCGTVTSTIAEVNLFTIPVAPVITANGPTTFCQGASVILTSSINNNIEWSNNETTPSITVTQSGTYSVVYTDANGCSATSNSIQVNVDTPLLPIDLGGPYTQCGGTVTLDAGTHSAGTSYLWSNGEFTQSISVSISGNYFVEVTNSCGSITSSTANVTINPLPATPIITASGPLNFCVGDSVVLTSDAANNLWSNGQTTASITVYTSGVYSVSTSDTSGCSAVSADVNVVVDNPLSTSIALGGPYTQCGGNVTLDAGNTGANFQWSNGETTQTILVLQSGSYYVTASNACGTVSSDTAVVTITPAPQTPVITANGSSTICQNDVLILTSSETQNITWSPGNQTTASISVNQSGIYTVTVDNGNGCTAVSQGFTVTVLNNITPVNIGTDIVQCGGSVSIDAGQQNGATYVWTDLSGNNQIPNGQIATLTSDGVVFVTVSNQCNTEVSNTINVTINPLPATPVIQANGPTTFCTGNSVQLEVVGASQNQNIIVNGNFDAGFSDFATEYNYQSNLQPEGTTFVTANASLNHPGFTGVGQGGAGNFLCVNGSSNTGQYVWQQTVTVVPNQTYDISLFLASMVANNNPGVIQLRVDGVDVGSVMNCPAGINNWVLFTQTWTAGANPTAVVSLHSMNSATGGNDFGIDNIQMICNTCTSNLSYLWNTSETGTSIIVDSTGSYTVTVTDAIGCSATSLPIDVLVQTPPTVNLGGPYTQCGGTVTLDAGNPGSTYLWSNGETTQTIDISTVGTTTVSVTITNTCGSFTSQPAEITIYSAPAQATITASGSTTFCQGDSVTLFANASTSYLWSPTNEVGQSIVVNQSGDYSVVTTDANGCTSVSNTITVEVLSGSGNPAQITASGPTTFCLGDFVVLSSNNPTGNLWNNGSNQQNLTVYSAGTYILNVTNASGCSLGSDTIVVTTLFNPTAVITLSNSPQLCEGDTLVLSVNQNVSYQWFQTINNQTVNLDTTQSIVIDTAGVYTVTVTGTNGCTATAQAVQILPAPAATAPSIFVNGQLACDGSGAVELSADGGSNFVWSTGQTGQTITINSVSIYWVTSQNQFGCKATSDTIYIGPSLSNMQIALEPLFYENGNYNVKCPKGTDGQITAVVSNGQEPYSYQWSTGQNTQVITGLTAQEGNLYKVVVTDAFGCTIQDSIVLVEPPPVLDKMPRGYSPDGNGVNDYLVIPGIEAYEPNHIVIFNRWGNEVYNSGGSYKNDWDGTGKNGVELPVGTYFVVLTADSPECGKIDENRWVELRRK